MVLSAQMDIFISQVAPAIAHAATPGTPELAELWARPQQNHPWMQLSCKAARILQFPGQTAIRQRPAFTQARSHSPSFHKPCCRTNPPAMLQDINVAESEVSANV